MAVCHHTPTCGVTIATTDRIDNLPAGTYSLVVTDANGCTNLPSNNTVTINEPATPKPTASITVQTEILCQGSSSGVLSASAINGEAPYTFLWNTGSTTENDYRLTPRRL